MYINKMVIIKILKKRKYFLIASLVTILFIIFQYLNLTKLKFISMMPISLIMIRSLPYKIIFVLSSLVIAILIGVSISLIVYQFSMGFFGKNFFGIFAGIISPVCITCLIGLVALILSIFGISLVALAPSLFRLDDIYVKSFIILILIASIYFSNLKIRKYEMVRLKENKNILGG